MENQNFIICRSGREIREEDMQRVNALADAECERIVNQRAGTSAPQATITQRPTVRAVQKKHPVQRALHGLYELGMLQVAFGALVTAAVLLGVGAEWYNVAIGLLLAAAADLLAMVAAI